MSDPNAANDNARYVTIAEIASATGRSEDEVLRLLAEMLRRRGESYDA